MHNACQRKCKITASLLLFSIALFLYILTLAPGVLGGDAGELQFVPYILGLTHPTGYPLLCLAGKLWSYLPIGTVAYRMNLLSAVFASLAIAAFHLAALKLTRNSIASSLAALTLASSYIFWSQAVIGDKYALNALFVVLVSGLAFSLMENYSPARLYALAFSLGLSLTHHRTMALFIPPLLLLAGINYRKISPKVAVIAKALLFFAAPLLLYVYVPIAAARGLPPGTWTIGSFRDFIAYIADMGYVKRVGFAWEIESIRYYFETLLKNFTPFGFALGLIGLIGNFYRARSHCLFLLTAFLLEAYLSLNYDVPRRWVFFLPSFILFTFWIAMGMAFLLELLERFLRGRGNINSGKVLLALALATIPALLFRSNYPYFREQHLDGTTLDIWRQELKQGHAGERLGLALNLVEPNAIIVCDWEQATIFWYMQQVEGLRKDVLIKYPVESLDQLAEKAREEGRPLYLARALPGIAHRWHPVNVGPLIRLKEKPDHELPSGIRGVKANFGNEVELAGFSYGEASFRPGSVIPLTIYWRALTSIRSDYSISIRLFNEKGQEILKFDSQHPVLGTYPTSFWQQGEVVSDYYEIPLPRSLPGGRYRWGLLVYRVLADGGWENLKVIGSAPPTDLIICDEFDLR